MELSHHRKQVNPAKFFVLVIPFLVALFVMPRIMRYEDGDGLTTALRKGNLALSELTGVTVASIGIMALLDLRTRRRW